MSQPTPSVAFSATIPAAPAGNILGTPQTNGGTPMQIVSMAIPNDWGVATKSADYIVQIADGGLLLVLTTGSHIFSLPAAAPGLQWKVLIANTGSGTLTVNPNGHQLDGATASLALSQNQGLEIRSDGSNYWSSRGIGGTGGITSIDGDTTPAQTLTASTGIAIVDNLVGDHEIAIEALYINQPATVTVNSAYPCYDELIYVNGSL